MNDQEKVKALVVFFTNSKDQMKKLVCFNQAQVQRIYTYGYVQKIEDANGNGVGLLDADHYFNEKAVL